MVPRDESRKQVLVAASPAGIALFARAMHARGIALRSTCDMAHALELAASRPDLIACGSHFADSQMFEFMREVRARPELAHIPLLCFRAVDDSMSPALLAATRTAAILAGASDFIDVNANPRTAEGGRALQRLADAASALLRIAGPA